MRRFLGFAFVLLSGSMQAQDIDWSRVDVNIQRLNPKLQPAHLTIPQRAAVTRLLAKNASAAWQACGGDASWIRGSSFYRAPLGSPQLIYIVPGTGCTRGGQGSNGGLWLVDLRSGTPRVIASPRLKFNGWGLGVQPHSSHGLRDFVIGWHMGIDELPLTYLRYDGHVYRAVGSVDLKSCTNVPYNRKPEDLCLPDGRPALDSTPPE
jgi:hypothetical protein